MDWIYDHVIMKIAGKAGQDRLAYLGVGLKTVVAHPYVGLGLKNIVRVLYTPVHNAYLQTAAETGVAGGLMLTSIVFYLTIKCALLAARATSAQTRGLLAGLTLGMIGLAIHFSVEPFYDNYLSWIYMGLAAGAIAVHDKPPLAATRIRFSKRWAEQ